jgi:hypothetical protein
MKNWQKKYPKSVDIRIVGNNWGCNVKLKRRTEQLMAEIKPDMPDDALLEHTICKKESDEGEWAIRKWLPNSESLAPWNGDVA